MSPEASIFMTASVSRRMGFGDEREAETFEARYDSVVRALQALRTALRRQPH